MSGGRRSAHTSNYSATLTTKRKSGTSDIDTEEEQSSSDEKCQEHEPLVRRSSRVAKHQREAAISDEEEVAYMSNGLDDDDDHDNDDHGETTASLTTKGKVSAGNKRSRASKKRTLVGHGRGTRTRATDWAKKYANELMERQRVSSCKATDLQALIIHNAGYRQIPKAETIKDWLAKKRKRVGASLGTKNPPSCPSSISTSSWSRLGYLLQHQKAKKRKQVGESRNT